MATEAKKEIIKSPYNPLDPIVVFDPDFYQQIILKPFEDIVNDNTSTSNQDNILKDDAINIPVIKVNNVILKDENIDQMIIYYDEFLPKVHLSVKDNNELIKNCDSPGLDNFINIVITAEVNGYYKKIALVFYITDFKVYNEYISYDGIYKYQPLNTDMFKQIGEKKLSTYELIEEIAKDTKMGFAATEDCKDIKDEKYRLIRSQSYKDYIPEQLLLSGTEEKQMFDCWVDLFGYLVLVNVYYAMNEEVAPEQLTIHSMVGLHSEAQALTEVKPVLLQRTLTNNKINDTEYNLLIRRFESEVNNNKIYNNGALNEGYYMTSPGKDNTISDLEIQVIENSLDGAIYSEQYEYKKMEFIGIEFEDTDVLYQKKVYTKYFDKIRSRRLKVQLTRHNLGLQRGTLVNVILKEYDNQIIKTIYNTNDIEDTSEGVVNPYTSGMYYIDGMEFDYVTEEHKIVQYLYLIKRGSITNPLNRSIEPVGVNRKV